MKSQMKYVILAFVVILITSISILFAWFTLQQRTTPINGTTTGVKFAYSINAGDVNQEKFEINNLVFFDIDNLDTDNFENEKNYFLHQATMIEIVLSNTGDIDLTYTISQVSPNTDSAYVLCFFSSTLLTQTDIDKETTLENLASSKSNVSGSLIKYNESTSIANSASVYVYIIGVQPNDDAKNSEFLNETYYFQIEINAIQKDGGN